MTRLLFVDDEPNILQGLRRMLRGERKDWEMHFVESGSAALEALEQQSFDIVVSDMKMPKMDGAELLTRVKELYPETVRIILSGHSERESVMKSVGPTHQFLAKPCDPDVLKATIRRAHALKSLIQSEPMQSLVAGLESIPSMPSLYREIVDELQNPNSSLEKVGEIIERDIGMSAQVLKIVNSAFFGLMHPVNSVPRSVAFLGIDTVSTLVLSTQVFSEFEDTAVPGFSISELWKHSILTGAVARSVARAEGVEQHIASDAFMAAALHDVGTLVLAGNVPEQFVATRRHAVEAEVSVLEAERSILHATHGEVGAYLVGLWGLPDSIVEAIAYHENPAEALDREFNVVAIVHVADVLAQELSSSTGESSLDLGYLEALGKADRVEYWRELAAELMEEGAVT